MPTGKLPSRGTVPSMEIGMKQFDRDGDQLLIGRTHGDQARHQIERKIAGLTDDGQVVALDFSGIKAVTVSFADGCLGQLLSGRLAGYYESHPFLVLNANEDVRDTLAATLERRGLLVLSLAKDRAEVLGDDRELNATMQAAHRLGRFRVNDLAKLLEVSPQAVNNRLKVLLRSGALGRTRTVPVGGGKEFEYFVPGVKPAIAPASNANGSHTGPRRRTTRVPAGGRK
jgi:STAS-like domain of unknown function (DUF4325)